jgi:hypothetical protein
MNVFKKHIILIILFNILTKTVFCQINYIKGVIIDTSLNKKLSYASIFINNKKDSTLYTSTWSLKNGEFLFKKLDTGAYQIVVTYPKMADYLFDIYISDTSKIDLGNVIMTNKYKVMEEVIVRAGFAIRMKGDTLEYNADSFAVKKGMNVEELLKRLPGIQVNYKGEIKAQGKNVVQVLVDGDEFFSDDPKMATRFLNANAIDKVQVFEHKSELEQITGIKTGDESKTINLKLKKNKKNGVFGKASISKNEKDYKKYNIMSAYFKGAKKISLYGTSKILPWQNREEYEDLSRYREEVYNNISDGTNLNLNTINIGRVYGVLPKTNNLGAFFTDKWKEEKKKVIANLKTENETSDNWINYVNQLFLNDTTSFTNKSYNTNSKYYKGTSGNASLKLKIDSFSEMKFSIFYTNQNGTSNQTLFSTSTNQKNIVVNKRTTNNKSVSSSQTYSSQIEYIKKFRKKTENSLIFLIQQEKSIGNKDDFLNTIVDYYNPNNGLFINKDTTNQLQDNKSKISTLATKITYTAAINKKLKLQFDYAIKNISNSISLGCFNFRNNKYSEKVDSLSNESKLALITNSVGQTINYQNRKSTYQVENKLFFSSYTQRYYNLQQSIKNNFINIAPGLNYSYKISEQKRIGIKYNGNTKQPHVEQLQPIVTRFSSLNRTIGNPNLKPMYSHNINLDYNYNNWKKNKYINISIGKSEIFRPIISKNTVDNQDNYTTQFINYKKNKGFSSNLNYSKSFKKLHLRPNIGVSFNNNNYIQIQNDIDIISKTNSISLNHGLAYENDKIGDIEYDGSININKSTTSNVSNSNTFTQTNHFLNINLKILKKVFFKTQFQLSTQPKSSIFTEKLNQYTWNSSLNFKALKNEKATITFSAFDILNTNSALYRITSSNSTYQGESFVIKRYFLLTVSFDFSKNF